LLGADQGFMSDNLQDLPLKLAKARQQLQEALAQVTKLEAQWLKEQRSPAPSLNENSDDQVFNIAELPQEAQREQAQKSVERYAQRLEILRQIDSGILNAHSIQDVVETTLKHLRQLIPCQRVSIILFDWTREEWLILPMMPTVPTPWDERSAPRFHAVGMKDLVQLKRES
jgi:hypothetical protein